MADRPDHDPLGVLAASELEARLKELVETKARAVQLEKDLKSALGTPWGWKEVALVVLVALVVMLVVGNVLGDQHHTWP